MTVQDPVCGMKFAKEQSAAELDHGDKTFYFCTEHCRNVFQRDPGRFLGSDDEASEADKSDA